MRLNRLDLNLLVALDALLDEKKTTAAAQRLSVSQSAISGMLARLRLYFEDDLLVQVGRQMELTPLGRDLADPVRQLILQIQATVAIRPTLSIATERRHFRITVSDYAVPILIAPLVRRLREQAPFITLELRPQIEATGQGLRRGETELTIVPDDYLDPAHPHVLLFEDTSAAWSGKVTTTWARHSTWMRSRAARTPRRTWAARARPRWPSATSRRATSRATSRSPPTIFHRWRRSSSARS
jgi:DNA-binding transcriptional LysR family regulator